MDIPGDASPSVRTPILIGTGLQLLMVIAGHYSPAIAQMFAPGGMGISALAGVLAALATRPASLGSAATRGAILVSFLLGDVPAAVLGFGTASSAVTGALGGLVGKLLSARAAQRA